MSKFLVTDLKRTLSKAGIPYPKTVQEKLADRVALALHEGVWVTQIDPNVLGV